MENYITLIRKTHRCRIITCTNMLKCTVSKPRRQQCGGYFFFVSRDCTNLYLQHCATLPLALCAKAVHRVRKLPQVVTRICIRMCAIKILQKPVSMYVCLRCVTTCCHTRCGPRRRLRNNTALCTADIFHCSPLTILSEIYLRKVL